MPLYKMEGKKDGLQKYKVRVNYVDNQGNYKQRDRITYGKAEAMELEATLTKQLNSDSLEKNDRKMTVQDLFDEYISIKKNEVRVTSLDKTVRVLNYYVLSSFADTKILDIDTSVLQKWKQSISERGLSIVTNKNILASFVRC